MEPERLLGKLKYTPESDMDDLSMLLSSSVDVGSDIGAMISVKRFPELSKLILEWYKRRKELDNDR